MRLDVWFGFAKSDAAERGLHDLVPLLEALQQATVQLRRAPWNVRADGSGPGRTSGPATGERDT